MTLGNRGTLPTRSLPRLFWPGVGVAALLAIGAGWLLAGQAPRHPAITVYKSPSCECCTGWVEHMRRNGFVVTVETRNDMNTVKKTFGIPDGLASCHTGTTGDYVVEGHVPAEDVHRLLRERPAVRGIALPGMPIGSPGMEIPGEKPERYEVLTFDQGGVTRVFANH
ncbi:MAG: DUF411 domain-containing protein [Magnetococcus sp. DMHC-8]